MLEIKFKQLLKGAISRQLGYSIWQRNYYEHIIRTDASYRHISNYIENNPTKWQSDELYSRRGESHSPKSNSPK